MSTGRHDGITQISLSCKSHASIEHVFIDDDGNAAIKSHGAKAALDAAGAAGGASAHTEPPPMQPDTAEDDGASGAEAVDKLLTEQYFPWFTRLVSTASKQGQAMPSTLKSEILDRYGSPDAAVEALLKVVKWRSSGYIAFHGNLRSNKTGRAHVAFLGLEDNGYPGKGMFLTDVETIVKHTPFDVWKTTRIQIRPRGIGTWKFGWEADGPVINGTHVLLCASLAWMPCLTGADLPQPLADLLEAIPAQYINQPDTQTRLLENFGCSPGRS